MDKLGSKTFSSQLMGKSMSSLTNPHQRLMLAVKNNNCNLIYALASKSEDLKEKDQQGQNLLFYSVAEKADLSMMYLLRAGVPYNQLDKQNRNIFHLLAYNGSFQCLQTLLFYIKLTKVSNLNDQLLNLLAKYGYKRTDMKRGKLKYPVSQKRQMQFQKMQSEIQDKYQAYLKDYLALFESFLAKVDETNQRNPIHFGCMNKFQKCLITLQALFTEVLNPVFYVTPKMLENISVTNPYFPHKIDPRNFQQTLHCVKEVIRKDVQEDLQRFYFRQSKKLLAQILQMKDKQGYTPLYIASKNGSTALINLIQKCASSPKIEEKKQIMKVADNNMARSLIIDLCDASKLSDVKPMNFLISCGQQVNGKKTIFGTFALIQSLKSYMEQNSLEPLKVLIQSGADVNAQDTNGWTVIHHASSMGLQEVVEHLINSSAETKLDVNKVTNKRYHPLHLAGMNEHPEVIKILIENPLSKVNIDVKDWDGCTALIHAAKKGSVKVLKTLLDMKADIYAKDVRDMTALHHAAFANHANCIKLLLNYDSDDDKLRYMRNTKGKLAKDLTTDSKAFENIFTAARTGNVNLMRKLIAQKPGCQDETTLRRQKTPLILAVQGGSLTCVKYLIDVGASTYHEDKNGKSANVKYLKKEKKEKQVKIYEQIYKLLQKN